MSPEKLTTFTASDGTVFNDLRKYRRYEMEKHFSFRNRINDKLVKLPGSVQGQPIEISNLINCEAQVLDHCDQVQIDDVKDSKVFIGASSESIFTRNCKNCTFTIACKQFRARDCENCTFYLYCKTEPVIETSTNLKFANFNGAYPGHEKAMVDANLDPKCNLWFSVYDFSDTEQTGINWRYVEVEREEPLWCPLGPAINCCPRIKAGSYMEGDKDDKSSSMHHFREAFVQFSESISTRVHSVFGNVIYRHANKSRNDAVPNKVHFNHVERSIKNDDSSLSLSSWKTKMWTKLTSLTNFFKYSNTQQNNTENQEASYNYLEALYSKLKSVTFIFSDCCANNQDHTNKFGGVSSVHEPFVDYEDTNSSKSSLTSNTKNTLNRMIDQGYWHEVVDFLGMQTKTNKEVKTCLKTDT